MLHVNCRVAPNYRLVDSSAMQRAKPVLAWQHFDLGELAIIHH
jgi:hypothetical protein